MSTKINLAMFTFIFQYILNLVRTLEPQQHCHLQLEVALFQDYGKLKLHKLNAGIQQGHMTLDVCNILKAQLVELQVLILVSQVLRHINICIPKSKHFSDCFWTFSAWKLSKITKMVSIDFLYNYSYNICVRKEDGYCCIQYYPCSDTGSWSISESIAATAVGTNCDSDYVLIDGAGATCTQGTCASTTPKICGAIFGAISGGVATALVCGKKRSNIGRNDRNG